MSINNPDEVLRELKKITKILTLSNGDRLRAEIERFATSDDRKKMWVLFDGSRQSGEIATTLSLTKRGVDKFLQALEQAGLMERPYNKPPRKTIDYVPAEWIELLPKNIESAATTPANTDASATQSTQAKPEEGATNG